MSIQELDEKTMNAMKVLADTNLKISEAKQAHLKLQEIETTYLEEREQKVIAIIADILKKSDDIIKQIEGNNQKVTDFYNTVSSFNDFLQELYGKVETLTLSFNQQVDEWEKKVLAQEAILNERKRMLDVQEKGIAGQYKELDRQKASLLKLDRLVNDKYATLQRTQERIKK